MNEDNVILGITSITDEDIEQEIMEELTDHHTIYDRWEEKYKPIPNTSPTAEGPTTYEDDGRETHYGYSTTGDDYKAVVTRESTYPGTAWTIVDGERNDNMYLVPGIRHVNRVSYLLTENSVTPDDKEKEFLYFTPSQE